MKVIFLDIDGVIALEKTRGKFSSACLYQLQRLVSETNAKLIIASSWRYSEVDQTAERLDKECFAFSKNYPTFFKDNTFGVTCRIYAKNTTTGKPVDIPRGVEIQEYLDKRLDIENYVIIDDGTDFLHSQWKHFVKVNEIMGLTESNVDKAIKILNS